jgi:hypothetical protein
MCESSRREAVASDVLRWVWPMGLPLALAERWDDEFVFLVESSARQRVLVLALLRRETSASCSDGELERETCSVLCVRLPTQGLDGSTTLVERDGNPEAWRAIVTGVESLPTRASRCPVVWLSRLGCGLVLALIRRETCASYSDGELERETCRVLCV